MTLHTFVYPSAWIFTDPTKGHMPVGARVPVEMPPSPNPRDCGNCGGRETMYAYEVAEKHGNIRRFGSHTYHLSLIGGPCPVCQGDKRAVWLEARSGLAGRVLDGKPMPEIRLTDVLPGPGQEAAFEAAWSLLAELPKPKTWALFSGAYGRGKTHILAGLVNGCRLADVQAEYTRAELLLSAIRDSYEDGSSERTSEVIGHYARLPALAIDELDRVRWTEWAASQLFSLLESRYTAGRATWFASNLGPGALEGLCETMAALISRISTGLVEALTGDDLRPAGGGLPVPAHQNGLPARYTE